MCAPQNIEWAASNSMYFNRYIAKHFLSFATPCALGSNLQYVTASPSVQEFPKLYGGSVNLILEKYCSRI